MPEARPRPGAQDLVPVTVIGGYLGAGKTTLINRLLAQVGDRRLAVLVNDFGAINVDVDLIVANDGQTIGLSNGCICCTIGDSLGDAIDEVMALVPPPDHIVIEASGVAEPAKVAAYGQGWPGCRLDAVVVLVDAERIRALALDRFVGSTVIRQLDQADLLVLTKADLLAPEQVAEVHAWLVDRPTASPTRVIDGQVALQVVLEAGPGSILGPDRFAEASGLEAVFRSRVLDVGPSIERGALEATLDGLETGVVRVKGVVALVGEADPVHTVQVVGDRREISPARSTTPIDHLGQLVVISVDGPAAPR